MDGERVGIDIVGESDGLAVGVTDGYIDGEFEVGE